MSEIKVSTVLVPLGGSVRASVPCVSLRFLCWPADLGIPWLGENMAPISAPIFTCILPVSLLSSHGGLLI